MDFQIKNKLTMKTEIGFFQDGTGAKSANRLIFVIGSIFTMGMCIYFAATGNSPAMVLAYLAGSQGSFTAMKLGQKSMETKEVIPETNK